MYRAEGICGKRTYSFRRNAIISAGRKGGCETDGRRRLTSVELEQADRNLRAHAFGIPGKDKTTARNAVGVVLSHPKITIDLTPRSLTPSTKQKNLLRNAQNQTKTQKISRPTIQKKLKNRTNRHGVKSTARWSKNRPADQGVAKNRSKGPRSKFKTTIGERFKRSNEKKRMARNLHVSSRNPIRYKALRY